MFITTVHDASAACCTGLAGRDNPALAFTCGKRLRMLAKLLLAIASRPLGALAAAGCRARCLRARS